jgi:predicted porin
MYGNIDVGFGSHKTTNLDGTVATKSSGVMDGSFAGSRIGFRGTEDLGGGLKANFVIEQGIAPTAADGFNKRTGSAGHQVDGVSTYSTGNNRQSYVGAAGGFGEVRAGYQYTNSYDVVAFNGFSVSEFQGGNFQNGTTVAGSSVSLHANGTRANAITYISPSFSGLTVKAQFGQGTGRQTMEHNGAATTTAAGGLNGYTANNNTFTSLMAAFTQGPVGAAVSYSKANLKTVAGAAPSSSLASPYTGTAITTQNAFGAVSAVTAPTNTGDRPQSAWNYGVSYDLGVAKLSYTGGKVEGASTSSTTETVTKANQISVKVPFGAADLVASTGSAKRTTGTTLNNDVKGTFIGVNYNLSKRTVAYVYTGTEKDKAVTSASTTAANYKDTKSVVGLRHAF